MTNTTRQELIDELREAIKNEVKQATKGSDIGFRSEIILDLCQSHFNAERNGVRAECISKVSKCLISDTTVRNNRNYNLGVNAAIEALKNEQ